MEQPGLRGDGEHQHHAQPHEMMLLGWAFDGYPIYAPHGHEDSDDAKSKLVEFESSYRLKKGDRPKSPEGPGGPYDGTY